MKKIFLVIVMQFVLTSYAQTPVNPNWDFGTFDGNCSVTNPNNANTTSTPQAPCNTFSTLVTNPNQYGNYCLDSWKRTHGTPEWVQIPNSSGAVDIWADNQGLSEGMENDLSNGLTPGATFSLKIMIYDSYVYQAQNTPTTGTLNIYLVDRVKFDVEPCLPTPFTCPNGSGCGGTLPANVVGSSVAFPITVSMPLTPGIHIVTFTVPNYNPNYNIYYGPGLPSWNRIWIFPQSPNDLEHVILDYVQLLEGDICGDDVNYTINGNVPELGNPLSVHSYKTIQAGTNNTNSGQYTTVDHTITTEFLAQSILLRNNFSAIEDNGQYFLARARSCEEKQNENQYQDKPIRQEENAENVYRRSLIDESKITLEQEDQALSSRPEAIKNFAKVVELFPSPAKDELNIRCSSLSNVSDIKMFDISGKLQSISFVKRADGLYRTNVSEFVNGVYIVKIQSAEGITVKRFTKF
jgi:hypothetical protein